MDFKPRKQHQFFQMNPLGRDFIVGDLHGQLAQFYRQLQAVGFDYQVDRVFCCGDLIGRGPNSGEALNLLTQKWFYSVMGNHEQLFLLGFEQAKYWDILARENGDWLGHTLHCSDQLMRWKTLIEICMPLSITLSYQNMTIGLVHASSLGCWSQMQSGRLSARQVWRSLWSRPLKRMGAVASITEVDAVVHGHCPVPSLLRIGNRYWTDTYAMSQRLCLTPLALFAANSTLHAG
ncbi:metallophosphoesterase [Vibrio hippocampi]|uniref:Serine/threonine-protein phosphatase 2 n=1 Tax=Vibrio hippocampi TaxID=654686 RepID=A0ABN8DK37_9VIBR|nr:metallophosphoesterase [Vibrio hippocampi]CAH0526221.1 Serine/threonine-protein phosphatase 2 [Vibrio hippocampi]